MMTCRRPSRIRDANHNSPTSFDPVDFPPPRAIAGGDTPRRNGRLGPGTVSRDDRQVCEHMQTPQHGLAVWAGSSSCELPFREALSCSPLRLWASPGFARQPPFLTHTAPQVSGLTTGF